MEVFNVFRLSHCHWHERSIVQKLTIEVFDFIKISTQIINKISKVRQI